jgi:valyl-tRNA synthetase
MCFPASSVLHLPSCKQCITSYSVTFIISLQVEKELGGIMGRLNNPKFVEKASADYIAEVRGQAADAQDRLSSIEQKLAQVQALKQQQ